MSRKLIKKPSSLGRFLFTTEVRAYPFCDYKHPEARQLTTHFRCELKTVMTRTEEEGDHVA